MQGVTRSHRKRDGDLHTLRGAAVERADLQHSVARAHERTDPVDMPLQQLCQRQALASC